MVALSPYAELQTPNPAADKPARPEAHGHLPLKSLLIYAGLAAAAFTMAALTNPDITSTLVGATTPPAVQYPDQHLLR